MVASQPGGPVPQGVSARGVNRLLAGRDTSQAREGGTVMVGHDGLRITTRRGARRAVDQSESCVVASVCRTECGS